MPTCEMDSAQIVHCLFIQGRSKWGVWGLTPPDNGSWAISGRFAVDFQVNSGRFAVDFQVNSVNSKGIRKGILKDNYISRKIMQYFC
jgi:hypothetical protein